MKKAYTLFSLLAGLALVLSACQPVNQPSSSEAAQDSQTQQPTQASPTEASPTQAAQEEKPTAVAQESSAQAVNKTPCRVSGSIVPEVKDSEWVLGKEDAKVTIIEYSDFMCPYCSMIEPGLMKLIKEYPEEVRLVYRHFPLISIHDKAALSTQAAEAAGLQGKFWEMHDLLFNKQQEWSAFDLNKFQTWLAEQAEGLGLDKEKFSKDLTSQELIGLSQKTYEEGASIGLPGTPTLIVNGVFYGGDPSFESLSAYVKKLGTIKVFDQCPPMSIDPQKKYSATFHLEKGDVVADLYADKAPITVNSFVFLAREGWYDGVTFHRVIPDFVAQGGDPYGTGSGSPGYEFINEIAANLSFGEEGVLGMANAGPDTNGSQFFITYAGIPDETVKKLDGNYTIFGKVVSGMDIIKGLTARDPSQNPNAPLGDVIKSITIEEK